jgi:hypothetical protein
MTTITRASPTLCYATIAVAPPRAQESKRQSELFQAWFAPSFQYAAREIPAAAILPLPQLIPAGSRPNANIGEGMEKSENVEKPQDYANHHDGIQDRLDRPLHRDEVIDQPQQNTHYDQNQQQLN